MANLKTRELKAKVCGEDREYIGSLLIMPRKYTSYKEKDRILGWRQKNVPIKVICEWSESNRYDAFSWPQKSSQTIQFQSISMEEEEKE